MSTSFPTSRLHPSLLLLATTSLGACASSNSKPGSSTVQTTDGGSESDGSESDGSESDGSGGDGSGGDDGDDSGEPDPRLALQMAAPANVETSRVATPDLCADCHSNAAGAEAMRLSDDTEVGPYNLQHSTMMANSARDPLFWAVLSAELAQAPSLTTEIETTCLRCHAPLATAEVAATSSSLPSAAELREAATAEAELGREGVSCTSCHRLEPEGLGAPETWTGHWQLAEDNAVYGPHADPFVNPMEHHTPFSPREGTHMLTSEVCASCHTLQTPTVVDAALSGHTFLEQATYLEWRNSDFADDGATPGACQSCHFPTTEADGSPITTPIARNPGGNDFPIEPRSPFGQHFQVGGNTFMLGILRDNADVLQPRADSAAFDATIARTEAMLRRAAVVALADQGSSGNMLDLEITVQNTTGHKLPTGYPARRAWLQLTVHDTAGELVFASGLTDDQGRILRDDGVVLASEAAGGPVQPHRTVVSAADEIVVYQSIMADPAGVPVFRLLHAAQMAKDNRLLPRGWRADSTDTEVGELAAVGLDGDPDFTSGEDRVRVQLAELGGSAPYTIDVALVYQSLSPRMAAELALVDTPEVAAFLAMAAGADWSPQVLAEAQLTVP